jgi:hypothetical protein
MLRLFGTFYGHLVHFTAIWYILRPFGNFVVIWYFFTVLVYFIEKNLATPINPPVLMLVHTFEVVSVDPVEDVESAVDS